MAHEYSVNQADLIAVADAIRTKGETTEALVFPSGFVTAIDNLKSGGIKAIAYASEDALPSSASDGAIAAISTTNVGEVYAQSAEPSEPQEGDMWIVFGAVGSVPVVAGNVTIYPSAASQYIGGSWVQVTILVWANNQWNNLIRWLLDYPDTCDDTTGGWGMYKWYSASTTETGEGFLLKGANNGNQLAAIQTLAKVDVSGCRKITFKGTVSKTYTNCSPRFGIQSVQTGTDGTDFYSKCDAYATCSVTSGEYTVVLDVSEYNDEYYVGVITGWEITVSQITME